MKSMELLRAIGEVDEEYIDYMSIENHLMRRKHVKRMVRLSCFACVMLVLLGCFVFPRGGVSMSLMVGEPLPLTIVYPDQNRPTTHTESATCYDWTFQTFQSLAAQSDVVVMGDVTAVCAERTELEAYTVAVTVRDILQGDLAVGDEICVNDDVFGMYQTLEGSLMLEPGNRVVLFLRQYDTFTTADGTVLPLYQYTQGLPTLGKFFLDRDGKYHEGATYSSLYTEKIIANYWRYIFEDYSPKTLEEIRGLIGNADES